MDLCLKLHDDFNSSLRKKWEENQKEKNEDNKTKQ